MTFRTLAPPACSVLLQALQWAGRMRVWCPLLCAAVRRWQRSVRWHAQTDANLTGGTHAPPPRRPCPPASAAMCLCASLTPRAHQAAAAGGLLSMAADQIRMCKKGQGSDLCPVWAVVDARSTGLAWRNQCNKVEDQISGVCER